MELEEYYRLDNLIKSGEISYNEIKADYEQKRDLLYKKLKERFTTIQDKDERRAIGSQLHQELNNFN